MTTWPTRTWFARASMLGLLITQLLGACSQPGSFDLPFPTPGQYQLQTIRYFIASGDRVDTTLVRLNEVTLLNPSPILVTQQIEEGFGELVKASLFSLDPTGQLPKDVDLSKLEVTVPQHWYSNGSFDRSRETYPLSPIQQQKPYGFDPNRKVTIQLPPNAKLSISRAITAYQLVCSFEATLQDTTTGQRHYLTGKWRGLLAYANPSTTLREIAL